MRKLLLRLAPVVLLGALACETTVSSLAPGQQRAYPGEPGRAMYEKSCSRCHALYMPRSYSAPEWQFFVRKYGRKARLKQDQRELVYSYLARNSRGR